MTPEQKFVEAMQILVEMTHGESCEENHTKPGDYCAVRAACEAFCEQQSKESFEKLLARILKGVFGDD